MYKFNPIYNKVPGGPCLYGKTIKYTLEISKEINSTAVNFVYCPDFSNEKFVVPMQASDSDKYITYEANVKFSSPGLFWYYFEVFQGEHKFYLQKTSSFDVEPTGDEPQKFEQLVCKSTSKTVDTFKGGIMYHIFVDRFCKSGKVVARQDLKLRSDWGGDLKKNTADDFIALNKECFGGNLKGIESKLPYFKSLNVSTLYLSPIFESNSYHKYNTANYENIDSMFGTEEDFVSLIKKAKQHDIRIVLDGVFNHTGADSKYFNKFGHYNTVGAYQSKKSPYYNWYTFTEYPDKYSSWWGIDTLPQITNNNKDFIKYIAGKGGIVEKYMKLGILGFRLDVVDELDEKTLLAICKAARGIKPNCLIIGEVWEDASNKIAYGFRRNYFNGNQLDSVMNYPLKNAIINYVTTGNSDELKNTLFMLKDHYPKEIRDSLMNILGTHDTERISTILTNNCKNVGCDDFVKLLKIATLLQYTVMGVPCIFYGDEQAVLGEGAPFCRVCFPWNKENKVVKNWYELLGHLRQHIVFKHGELNVIESKDGLFGFERVVKNRKVLIYTNCSDQIKTVELDGVYTNYETAKQTKGKVKVMPFKYLILVK